MFARQAMGAREAEVGPRQEHPKDTLYEVMLVVFFGAKQKGDLDNLAKLPLDGLVKAGVIRTDAAIVDLTLRKRRDRDNPRTEIWVREATQWEHLPSWDRNILYKQRMERATTTRLQDPPPKPDPPCHCGKKALTKVGKKGFCAEHAQEGKAAAVTESHGKTARHASDAYDRGVARHREADARGLSHAR